MTPQSLPELETKAFRDALAAALAPAAPAAVVPLPARPAPTTERAA